LAVLTTSLTLEKLDPDRLVIRRWPQQTARYT
jgi:hypothetical protein